MAEETSDTDTTQASEHESTTEESAPDLATELQKWKAMARKHESESKANAKAAAKLAEIEEANKTELERALSLAAEADKRAQQADERATRALVKAKASAVATAAGAIDIDAVLALMPSDAVTVDGDEVNGVGDAIDALRQSKPHLFGKSKPTPGSADGGKQSDKPAQWTEEQVKSATPDQINEARRAGLLTALMSGN